MKELHITNGTNTIYGKLFSPKTDEKCPAVIMSHGYNGCHTDFFDDARFFATNGYVVYCYDFCGGSTRSLSTGSSTDMTIHSEKSDLTAVVNYIKELPNVDEKRIYLLGASQGGLVSALVADELPDVIKACALYYPALCIPDNWRDRYPEDKDIPATNNFWGLTLSREFFVDVKKIDITRDTGKYSGPVLIIHGDSDEIVPLWYSEDAVKRYADAALKVLAGERHGFSPSGAATARETVLEFFNSTK